MIIQRDENGFGLTVSGDNPVFVQLVKEGKSVLTHVHPTMLFHQPAVLGSINDTICGSAKTNHTKKKIK